MLPELQWLDQPVMQPAREGSGMTDGCFCWHTLSPAQQVCWACTLFPMSNLLAGKQSVAVLWCLSKREQEEEITLQQTGFDPLHFSNKRHTPGSLPLAGSLTSLHLTNIDINAHSSKCNLTSEGRAEERVSLLMKPLWLTCCVLALCSGIL